MGKPEPHDFGITPEQIRVYRARRPDLPERVLDKLQLPMAAVGVIATFLSCLFILGAPWWFTLLVSVIAGPVYGIILYFSIYLVLLLACIGLTRLRKYIHLSGLVRSRVELFEKAEELYSRSEQQRLKRQEEERQEEIRRQSEVHESRKKIAEARQREEKSRQREEELAHHRKLVEYWVSLPPLEFERELAEVYRKLGFHVRLTPKSGDHGIDIELRKGGKFAVVQCKRQKSPAGERVARELLGSMAAVGADKAVLACTGGFTKPAKDFVRSKPIDLVTVEQLARLGERAGQGHPTGNGEQLPLRHGPTSPRKGVR